MDAKWYTPAVTVLDQAGQVDLASCSNVYTHLIESGIDGILILGSLGEFFALPMAAKKQIITNAVATVNRAVPIVAGTNCMVVEECIEFSNYALQQGVAAVMVIPPYYFNLPEEASEAFFDQLASNIDGPIYLYNFPGVTGYDLSPELVTRLALKHDNIIGIKDTVPNMDHTRAIIQLLKDKRPGFEVFSGFDENFAHNLLCGGNGCMASTSNFAPEISVGFANAARRDDLAAMVEYQRKIDALMPIYRIAGQFVPIIKQAMQLRGIISSAKCTAPLQTATEEQTQQIINLLKAAGLDIK